MKLHTFGASHTQGYLDMNFRTYKQYRDWLGVSDVKDMPPIWVELLSKKLKCDSYINHGQGGASNAEIFFSFTKTLRVDNGAPNAPQKGDIVIINWASTLRQMWIKDNAFVSMASANQIHEEDEKKIPFIRETYDNIRDKRRHPQFIWETRNYENIIDYLSKLVGFKVYYWFTDDTLLATTKGFFDGGTDKYLIWDLITKHYGKQIEDILSPHITPDLTQSKWFNEEDEFSPRIEKLKQLSRVDNRCCITFGVIDKYGGGTIYEDTDGNVQDIYHLGETGQEIQAELFYNYIKNTKTI